LAEEVNKRKETIMMTLRQFSEEPSTIPTIASWYLADLSEPSTIPTIASWYLADLS